MSEKNEKKVTDAEYNFYKQFKKEQLSNSQKSKLISFQENQKKAVITPAVIEYNKRLWNRSEPKKRTYNDLLNALKLQFAVNEKSTFDDNQLNNINTILYYFLKDKKFFQCSNLSSLSKPSFDKGLLIVGGYGVGKSVTMECLHKLFLNTEFHFKFSSANKVVSNYDGLKNSDEKKSFFNSVCDHRMYIDDLKTERDANNFGRINLFKEILEERINNKKMTFASCNYAPDDDSNSLQLCLEEFHNRYGARVYDRIFQMFNIVEFFGQSMRK